MGVVVEKGTIGAATTTGVQTYNLGASFSGITPKFVILWTTWVGTAEVSTLARVDQAMTVGIGTYDGGAAQNIGTWSWSDDAATTSVCDRVFYTDAILKWAFTDTTTAADVATLDSLNAGDFRLNWTNAASSAVRIHYLAVGGTDVTAARCGSFTNTASASTSDVTVNSGWGQPDAMMFLTHGFTALTSNTAAMLHLSAATGASDARCAVYKSVDAAPTMNVASLQTANALHLLDTGILVDAVGNLSAKASYPTDGFRIAWSDTPGSAFIIGYLAIKGTMAVKTGSGTAPTAGGLPVAQTLTGTASTTAKGALLFTTGQTNAAGVTSTGTRLGQWSLGGWDGTNEGVCSIVEEDANTASISSRNQTNVKVVQMLDAGTPPAIQSEADGGLSGADATLSWTDIDSQASEYSFVIFGEAAGGPATVERSASLSATGAITSAPQRALLRSSAVAATAAIAMDGHAIKSRSAAFSATAAVTSAGLHIAPRSAALSATAAIASSGQVEGPPETVERSAGLSATAAIASDGHGILSRSAALGATAAIASAGVASAPSAPPTLEAQGTTDAVDTGVPSVVIPTHQAGDIIVIAVIAYVPLTGGGAGDAAQIPTPTGSITYTLIESQLPVPPASPRDGWIAWWWGRADSAGETVTLTRGSGWDASVSSCFGARAYVIRGAYATGDPWDDTSLSSAVGSANGSCAAVTVSGTDRTVIQFWNSTDNQAAGSISGWTAGTQSSSTAGSDCAFQTFRKDDVSSSTTADAGTSAAPAAGRYAYLGISFKPAAGAVVERSASLTATAAIASSGRALSGVVHRAFDGTGNLESGTNVNNLTGAFTVAAVIRQTTSGTTPFVWLHATSGYAARASMSLSATGLLSVGTGSARVAPTLNLVQADGWGIVAVSKAAGTATPRFHVYKGGSWSHENASGTVADALTHSGGRVLFGTSVAVDYRVDLAVAGEWDSALSDGDIETLDWATQNWADLSPLSLWDFDQTVTTDTIPDLVGAVDLAGLAGVPIDTDGPDGWVYGLGAEHERSASLSATAAIASAPQRVRVRSAALGATAAIASDGHGILSRSAALTATASIASAPQRVRVRSAALSATGSITSTAVFFSIVERAGALTALASLSVGAYQRVHVRSASFTATASITSASQAAGVHQRSASLTAAGSIAAAGQRALHRSASFGASTTIQAASQRALSRQASLAATASIETTGEISTGTERSASFTATASIDATGEVQAAVERSASFTATAGISASPQRVLSRRASVGALAFVGTTPQRVLARSAALSASASIAVAGHIAEVFSRSSSILAVAEISASGVVFGPGPAEETHPKLGGIFDQTVTGGIVAVSVNGGTVAESSRGGTVTEPSRGATTPALRSGVVIEPSRGGEPDGDQSGEFYEFLTGGRVAEHVHNGVIANARGAVLHEPTRGGVLTLARSGTPEEPKRGGTFDESLTNGEVF